VGWVLSEELSFVVALGLAVAVICAAEESIAVVVVVEAEVAEEVGPGGCST
jgi:hypothetical protein